MYCLVTATEGDIRGKCDIFKLFENSLLNINKRRIFHSTLISLPSYIPCNFNANIYLKFKEFFFFPNFIRRVFHLLPFFFNYKVVLTLTQCWEKNVSETKISQLNQFYPQCICADWFWIYIHEPHLKYLILILKHIFEIVHLGIQILYPKLLIRHPTGR